jgi:hypothetical protein
MFVYSWKILFTILGKFISVGGTIISFSDTLWMKFIINLLHGRYPKQTRFYRNACRLSKYLFLEYFNECQKKWSVWMWVDQSTVISNPTPTHIGSPTQQSLAHKATACYGRFRGGQVKSKSSQFKSDLSTSAVDNWSKKNAPCYRVDYDAT